MTLADELTAVWDGVRPVFADAFHPDSYQVVRNVPVSDGSGGTTDTPTVVETGRCSLEPSNRMGDERLSGDVVVAQSSYIAELSPAPIGAAPATKYSIVKATDTLEINGRTFQITTKPRSGGNHGMFTLCDLEERT